VPLQAFDCTDLGLMIIIVHVFAFSINLFTKVQKIMLLMSTGDFHAICLYQSDDDSG